MSEDLQGVAAAHPRSPSRIDVLLIEDDDGDAFLVQELLHDEPATADAPAVRVQRAGSLATAKPLLARASCVLLDLGLPDATGLDGIRWLQEQVPDMAVVVLTGLANELLGAAAVRSGAQDYLVKGHVDGALLYRVIRYAVERKQAEKAQLELSVARIQAQENARLARGLLPSPLVFDPELTVATRYRPGGGQRQLGGDFYDFAETPDGWLHALVGDVCGRGPDEAALGVCLRVAWRTMVLAGQPAAGVLSAVQQVLEYERHDDRMFATLCMLSVAPDRRRGLLHLAGHPRPLLIGPSGGAGRPGRLGRLGVRELATVPRLPLGVLHAYQWPAVEVELGEDWTVLLYTDGLIEGRVGDGSARLGSDGLVRTIEEFAGGDPGSPQDRPVERLLDYVVGRVRDLNGGDLDDDLALLAVQHHGRYSR